MLLCVILCAPGRMSNLFLPEGPDPLVNISARIISPEPMYLIMNLGYSHGFGEVRQSVLISLCQFTTLTLR